MPETLQDKLNIYTKNTLIKNVPLFRYTISYFILLRDNKQYSSLSKTFDEDLRKLLLHDIKRFIKSSFTTYSIRKGVYYALKNDFNWQKAADEFNLNVNDLLYCWDILDNNIKYSLIKQAPTVITDIFTENQLYDILKELKLYCVNISNKYLRFISNYDKAHDQEDLVQDLLIHALTTIRRYDDFRIEDGSLDFYKIINYTKASIYRYAINIIKSNTNPRRSRIENISLNCGYCIYCKKEEPHNCVNFTPQYQPTVLSLDYILPSSDGRNITFHEILADEDATNDDSDKSIKKGLSERLTRFIDIVAYNETDKEFDFWLQEKYNLIVDDILPNYKVLANHTMEFLQLSHKNIMSVLTPKCSTWSRKVKAHCVSCVSFTVCKNNFSIRKNSKACDLYQM